MTALYNEIEPYAAEWLRRLIAEGLIAPGVVDERSIEDLEPDYVRGFTQFHAFAGIGVWSHALRLAGWSDDRPVWTGSCPCQPFSAAGKGAGFADERHLWPAWFHLISQCRPPVVLGEQVASKDGLGWLDLVQADLQGAGYAVGAQDLCVAGVGGPHIRQRLWFVGVAEPGGAAERRLAGKLSAAEGAGAGRSGDGHRGSDATGRMADAAGARRERAVEQSEGEARDEARLLVPGAEQSVGRLADTDEQGSSGRGVQGSRQGDGAGDGAACERPAGLRTDGGVADAPHDGRREERSNPGRGDAGDRAQGLAAGSGAGGATGGVEDPELPPQPRLGQLSGKGLREQEAMRPAGGGVADGLVGAGTDAGLLCQDGIAGRLADADGRQSGQAGAVQPCGQAGAAQPCGQHGQQPEDGGTASRVANAPSVGRTDERERHGPTGQYVLDEHGAGGGSGLRHRAEGDPAAAARDAGASGVHGRMERPGPTNGFWSSADWLFCRDGKWRPVEPGTFPLVDGAPARVGRLRAYGNAISPWPAKAFIEAVQEFIRENDSAR